MEAFMNYDFNINKIVLAIFVPAGIDDAVHKNRPSHGLVINKVGDKTYTFSDGKNLPQKKMILFTFPNIQVTQSNQKSTETAMR